MYLTKIEEIVANYYRQFNPQELNSAIGRMMKKRIDNKINWGGF